MNSQSKIMELLSEHPGNTDLHDQGAWAEEKVKKEQPHLEPGTEAFYAEVLAIMEESQ